MRGKRILVVEDETVVQLHLRRIVEELGCRVIGTAMTGAEALALAAVEPPDLVMMDVRIPGDLDGIDTAREIKARHRAAVVFVTAYADEQTVSRIEAVGASGYVVKPFSPAEVRVALSTALQGQDVLLRLEERARTLGWMLGSVGDAILAADRQGRVTHWTPQAGALTAWDEAEAVGRSIHEVVRTPGAADSTAFRHAVDRTLEAARSELLLEMQIVARDGRERLVRGKTTPILDAAGAAEGFVLALHDTARQRPSSGSGVATEPPFHAATERGGPRSAAPSHRRAGPGKRMLIYSHDTFGLGHLRRCLNLSTALLERHPHLSILIATGSSVAHRFPLPSGADYVKLPAVKKVASERYEARSLEMPDEDILRLRTNLLRRAARDFEPDLLLVDHAPAGMRGEMLPTLEWLSQRGGCARILGLRDIVDAPESVVATWESQGVYDLIDTRYDHVLVYGMQDVFDPVTAYRFPERIAAKTRFVGYVTDADQPDPAPRQTFFDALPKPLVVVTIGGGDGGGETVIGNWLEMLRRCRSQVDFWSVILTGPLIPEALAARFAEESRGLPVTLRDFVPSTRPYVRRADLVVCTAGYNTMTQVLAAAPRALVVPRIMHREEQLIRARRLAAMGLVDFVHPDQVTPERLFEAVRAQLSSGRAPLAEARARHRIRFDGAERVAEFCGEAVGLALANAGGNE